MARIVKVLETITVVIVVVAEDGTWMDPDDLIATGLEGAVTAYPETLYSYTNGEWKDVYKAKAEAWLREMNEIDKDEPDYEPLELAEENL